ncbi:hypothetical protein CI610_03549 [invertebrate metagenome]|uniref:Uncharacterized protein n=1 Tax=invertebrate metagenome TaxID=1711999 RepID=A0A2H9T2S1_9ZZZZ
MTICAMLLQDFSYNSKIELVCKYMLYCQYPQSECSILYSVMPVDSGTYTYCLHLVLTCVNYKSITKMVHIFLYMTSQIMRCLKI